MDIFPENLTTEETNSQFTLNEVDNESFALEQMGGVYPADIPNFNPDATLNSMNENREQWEIVAGSDISELMTDNYENQASNDISAEQPPNEEPTEQPQPIQNSIPEDNNLTEDIPAAIDISDFEEQSEQVDEPELIEENEQIQEQDTVDDTPRVAESFEPQATTIEDSDQISEEVDAFADSQTVQQISSIDDIFNMDAPTGAASSAINATAEEQNIEEADTTELSVPPPSFQIDDGLRSLLENDMEEEVNTMEDTTSAAEYPTEEPNPNDATPAVDEEPIMAEDNITKENMNDNIKPNEEEQSEPDEISWDSETNQIKTKQKVNKKPNNADKKSKRRENQENDMTEEEEKNNTKKFALILVIVAVVMIFIIGGIIGYLYLSNKSNIQTTTEVATTENTKDSTVSHTTETKSVEDSTKADTNKLDTNKTNIAATDTTAKVATNELPKDTNVPATNANQPLTQETTKPKIVQRQPPTQQQAPAKPRATTKPKTETTTRTTTAAKTTQKTNADKPEPIYSIQMYSSPSKPDAEERLVILARKNITGYITTQQIKGQTWYRVRFGRYSSYEQAVAEVNRLGLADAWIERVR